MMRMALGANHLILKTLNRIDFEAKRQTFIFKNRQCSLNFCLNFRIFINIMISRAVFYLRMFCNPTLLPYQFLNSILFINARTNAFDLILKILNRRVIYSLAVWKEFLGMADGDGVGICSILFNTISHRYQVTPF